MAIVPPKPETVPYNTPGTQTTGAPPWLQNQQNKFSSGASPAIGTPPFMQNQGASLGGGPTPSTPTGGVVEQPKVPETPKTPTEKPAEVPKVPETPATGGPTLSGGPAPGTFGQPIEGVSVPATTGTSNGTATQPAAPAGWEQWAQWFQQIMLQMPGMGYGNPWMQGGGYGGGWGMPGAWGYQPPGYGGYPSQGGSWPTIGYLDPNSQGYRDYMSRQQQQYPFQNQPSTSSSAPSGNTMTDRKKRLPTGGPIER